jgi:hypothetical protein
MLLLEFELCTRFGNVNLVFSCCIARRLISKLPRCLGLQRADFRTPGSGVIHMQCKSYLFWDGLGLGVGQKSEGALHPEVYPAARN